MSVAHYVETLTLADATLSPSPARPFRSIAEEAVFAASRNLFEWPTNRATPSLQRAAVDVGSLISFVEGVRAQDQDDVLFSVQLAQRGASGAFDRFDQTEAWYGKYAEILENLGWTSEQLVFAKYDQSEGEFRMDKAALAIITAIATQNQLAVLKESVSVLSSLAEDDGTIRLFDFHTSAQASGNFQLGAVEKANGALAMALGGFYFSNSDQRRRFLFFTWGARQVSFWTAAQKLTLNPGFYANHRDVVRRKLGVAADDFIAGLQMG